MTDNAKPAFAGTREAHCSVPRRFVVDVDSLLSCLLCRHRTAVDATGEYAEIARLAHEARKLSEAPNKLLVSFLSIYSFRT